MVTSLLTIPPEIRLTIFEDVLATGGCIALQWPIWTTKDVFTHSLMQVCRGLRDEAIKVFYKCNRFLAYLDVPGDSVVDVARYPINCSASTYMFQGPLTCVVPWLYPDLLQQLRYLHLNIRMNQGTQGRTSSGSDGNLGQDSSLDLEHSIKRLAEALQGGCRLKEFCLRICEKTPGRTGGLSPGDIHALDAFSNLQIRGPVRVAIVDGDGTAIHADVCQKLRRAIQVAKA